MKTLFSLLTLLLVLGSAQAGDVSCQVDVLKPKMNASIIKEEAEKPADLTVAEARLRLKNRQQVSQQDNSMADQEQQTEKEEPAKKESGLGSMFDILLPSKLRNPVQK
jgi:ribosomal protein L12E/L44/L45/RPP1/RPP2